MRLPFCFLSLCAFVLLAGCSSHDDTPDFTASGYLADRGTVRIWRENHNDTVHLLTIYTPFTGAATENTDYIWQNARCPVKFTDAVSSILHETPNATFLEISPHPVLSGYIVELGAKEGSVYSVMRRSKEVTEFHETRVLLNCIGKLVSSGMASVDFASLNEVESFDTKSIRLPAYPLSRRKVPYLPESSPLAARHVSGKNGQLNDPRLKINSLTHPELAQHVINGEPIMPAAGYLEMVRINRYRLHYTLLTLIFDINKGI